MYLILLFLLKNREKGGFYDVKGLFLKVIKRWVGAKRAFLGVLGVKGRYTPKGPKKA